MPSRRSTGRTFSLGRSWNSCQSLRSPRPCKPPAATRVCKGLARRGTKLPLQAIRALPTRAPRNSGGKRLGHGQGREESPPVPLAAIQKPGHGRFQRGPSVQAKPRPNFVNIPWPLRCRCPARPCLPLLAAAALCFALSQGCRGPSLALPHRPEPASTAATPAPSPACSAKGRASIPASFGWSV